MKQLNTKITTGQGTSLFLSTFFLIAMLTLLSSCSQQARHKNLTFFFTGVPSLGEDKGKKERGQPRQIAMTTKESDDSIFSSHSYYTSKKCAECHQTSFTRNFGGSAKSGMPTVSFAKNATGDGNWLPLKKVCINCHKNRSAEFASKNNLWMHAPQVTMESCTLCHSPHQSRFPALLKDTTEKLCTMCHSEGLIRLTREHLELKNCIDCHNPHVGKDKYLLVEKYKEVRQIPNSSPSIASKIIDTL